MFSIEGNALTGRTDLTERVAEYDDSMDPPDYVTVNYYPLDSPRILGYGVPEYGDRTELTLTGFVDLGNYAEQADVFAVTELRPIWAVKQVRPMITRIAGLWALLHHWCPVAG